MIKSIVANPKIMVSFFYTFAYCHYDGCQKCEKHYKKMKNICFAE